MTNPYRFLKGATSQGAGLLTIYAMASNGHKMTFSCHDITKQGQMAVIDIGTVERDDETHLTFYGFPYSLNAKGLKTEI